MSEPFLPKDAADQADVIAALVDDEIAHEDPIIRARLRRAIEASEQVFRWEPTRLVVIFPTVDGIAYAVPLIRLPAGHARRLDA